MVHAPCLSVYVARVRFNGQQLTRVVHAIPLTCGGGGVGHAVCW